MHQHPRLPPTTASSVSSPRTNPKRTNNSRDEKTGSPLKNQSQEMYGGKKSIEDTGGLAPIGPNKDALKKLDQIIQNFHTKAAILVLQSRLPLPVIITQEGTKKINKWFQLETDDTNSFRQELNIWRHCGSYSDRPPPLIIETYIDTSGLTGSQGLVIVDDVGKRWDALNASFTSSREGSRYSRKYSEIMLERWRFELKELPNDDVYDFGSILPTVYKKFIIFFRSLYATTKFLPTGKLVRNIARNGTFGSSIKINCRILNGRTPSNNLDALLRPLFDNGSVPVTSNYILGTTDTPVGQVYAEVSYRLNCDFQIDDKEALLSSKFMGADKYFFQPSLGFERSDRQARQSSDPESVFSRGQSINKRNSIQLYDDLPTFYGDASFPNSSPINTQTFLRHPNSQIESSPVESLPRSRPMHVSRNSINSTDGITVARRPSVSFQPFKAGSLSSSPGHGRPTHRGEVTTTFSSQSSPRTSGLNAFVQTRRQSSLKAGSPATLRGVPIAPEHAITLPVSGSPKSVPVSRYSSSFSRRKSQAISSTYGRSVTDEDQSSCGKQSPSSSTQHGPLNHGDIVTGGTTGSLQSDDDNISEFLKVLERQKTLKSFEISNEMALKWTGAQLSKYQSLRESHNALTESMSSSTLLNRSSSSSRQILNMAQKGPPSLISASSSPGKPVSPHTPAIPSRLSANSIVEYTEPCRTIHGNETVSKAFIDKNLDESPSQHLTIAIDIPHSPQTYYPISHRPNSMTQHRSRLGQGDTEEMSYAIHRSLSVGADHYDNPSRLSTLLKLGQTSKNLASTSSTTPLLNRLPYDPKLSKVESCQLYSLSQLKANETSTQPEIHRNSYKHRSEKIQPDLCVSPSQPDFELMFMERQNELGSGKRPDSSSSITRSTGTNEGDDESLVFQMSELGR